MLQMLITDAGRDALVDAEAAVTGPIEIATIGLTNTPSVMAPTPTAIPGQLNTLQLKHLYAGSGAKLFKLHPQTGRVL